MCKVQYPSMKNYSSYNQHFNLQAAKNFKIRYTPKLSVLPALSISEDQNIANFNEW